MHEPHSGQADRGLNSQVTALLDGSTRIRNRPCNDSDTNLDAMYVGVLELAGSKKR
jgi:hypothetical protein